MNNCPTKPSLYSQVVTLNVSARKRIFDLEHPSCKEWLLRTSFTVFFTYTISFKARTFTFYVKHAKTKILGKNISRL